MVLKSDISSLCDASQSRSRRKAYTEDMWRKTGRMSSSLATDGFTAVGYDRMVVNLFPGSRKMNIGGE